jgi:hypothetical protein
MTLVQSFFTPSSEMKQRDSREQEKTALLSLGDSCSFWLPFGVGRTSQHHPRHGR